MAPLSVEDQLGKGDAISKRAETLSKRLTKMLYQARREKDIMRANCINRKLTEVNANGKTIDSRMKAMKQAADTNDQGRVGHEFAVLTVLSQKLDVSEREAAQCLGQSIFEPGAAQVISTIPLDDAKLPDPTLLPAPAPAPPPAFTVPPPVLSGTN